MIRLGIVEETKDITSGGVLKITPIDSKGQLAEQSIEAVQCAPNAGDGQGIFTIPGPGSIVMFVDASDTMARLAKFLQTSDVGYKYVWLGALAGGESMQRKGQSGVTADKNDADDGNNTQKDYLGRDPRKGGLLSDKGIAQAGGVYADNFIPQQDIWKTKNGHKFIMSHKITDKGRHDNSILTQSAGGKFIRIDDGPAELKMDRIEISDEHRNRFIIKTGGTRPDSSELYTIRDQDQTSERGNQTQTIMGASEGSQLRHNYGAGNIEDKACKGNHTIEAEKDMSRFSHTGNILEVAFKGNSEYTTLEGTTLINAAEGLTLVCGGSVIEMKPNSIDITSAKITLNGTTEVTGGTTTLATGVVLDTHFHIGNLGGPTSPPQ